MNNVDMAEPTRIMVSGGGADAVARNLSTAPVGLLAIAFGLSGSINMRLGAELFGSDIFVLAALPFALYYLASKLQPLPRPLTTTLWLTGLWLVAAALSDIVNHAAVFNWLRGLSIIAVFAISLLIISVFIAGRRTYERMFLISLLIGLYAWQYLTLESQTFGERWKFELGVPTVIALALVFDQRRWLSRARLFVELLVLGTVGIVSLFLDFRSLAGFTFLAVFVGLYKLIRSSVRQRAPVAQSPAQVKFSNMLGPVAIIGIAILLSAGIYVHALTHDWLSSRMAQRIERSQAKGFGPIMDAIVGSRPQLLITSYAIQQRPILGYGSWPQNCSFVELFRAREARLGIVAPVGLANEIRNGGCLIPTHSYLFGAWVWAGILAVPLWLYLLWRAGVWLIRAARDVNYFELAPFLMGTTLIWDILFSPFNGRARLTAAFYLAVIFSREIKRSMHV